MLLFYSFAHHRDPHSFPTRRSSDLACTSPCAALHNAARLAAGPSMAHIRRVRQPLRLITVGDSLDASLDRKSTRLNSSHVRISYAVFCLKKKKLSHSFVVS